MISNKIDLTENGDFRDGNPRNAIISEINKSIALHLSEMDSMSLKDYEKLERYVEIFGKEWHDNRKYEIFDDVYFKRYLSEYGYICQCCGTEIRKPWSSHYGLCEKCNSEIENSEYENFNNSRMTKVGASSRSIPWRRTRLIPDLARSGLFDLR